MSEDAQRTLLEKTAKLESLQERVKQFVDSGGDLKSPEAVPLGMEFIRAFDDVAKELARMENTGAVTNEEATESDSLDAFLKLFSFDKKRDVEKYCRDLVIDSSDFANFIIASEVGVLPWLHKIHYRDHVPEHLHLTDRDTAAIAANPVGPLQPGAKSSSRK